MSKDNSSHLGLAVLTACTAVMFLFLMNVFAKLVMHDFTTMETTFWRNLFATIILLPFVIGTFGFKAPPMGKPKTMVVRSVFGSLTLMLSTAAYFNLPLADANAIILSAPLILTLLAAKFLHENVTRARMTCTILGLLGVLIIAQPSGALSFTGTAYAVTAALSLAGMRMLLRHLGKTEDALSVTFYFLVIGTIFTAFFMPFVGHIPPLHTLPILIAMSVCGAMGQYLNALSYKYGDASFTGIFVYTQLLWAIPFDYFLWDHAPNLHTILGGAIIIASNITIVMMERRRKRALALAAA